MRAYLSFFTERCFGVASPDLFERGGEGMGVSARMVVGVAEGDADGLAEGKTSGVATGRGVGRWSRNWS